MKKWTLVLLLVCCIALFLVTGAAADTTIGDYTYSLRDGVLWLVGYKGVDAEVEIPATAEIDGVEWKLREIADGVFQGNLYIKSVIVPENVQHMGARVFCDCTNLESVTLSSTVNRIGNAFFKNCANLRSVTINGTLEDCSSDSSNPYRSDYISVFYNASTNSDTLTVTFGPEAERVPGYLFATGYASADNVFPRLTAVKLSAGIKEIGTRAFYNCYTFPGIELNEGLKSIGGWAFENCYGLTGITLPSSLTTLGSCVFKNCTNLSAVTINGNLEDVSADSTSPYRSEDNSVFYNSGTNTDSFAVTFGPKVTRIPGSLFATGYEKNDNVYAHVTSVVLSDAVSEIGAWAFCRCYDLRSVQVGNGLKEIEGRAFLSCTALPGIELNEGLKSIDEYAFENCIALSSITIPASVTELKSGAFKNCTNLSAATFNGNLEDASADSISPYRSADNAVFYNSGTNADSFTVSFGLGVTRVPGYLFATGYDKNDNVYAHVTKVVLSDTVNDIGLHAFTRCYDLQTVQLGKGLQTISECAFWGCSALPGIELNEGLESIGSYAFENCAALESITVPSSVTKLDPGVFKNCTNLSAVTVYGDLEDASSYSTSPYRSEDNSIFYNTGINVDSFTVTFGPHVTRIPAYLFATGKAKTDKVYAHITAVYIPDTVEEIGEGAFHNCYDLASFLYGGSAQRWTWMKENAIGKNNASLIEAAAVYNYCLPAPIPRELEILRITVRDGSGELVDFVPAGDFLASVTIKNLSSMGNTTVLLAAYTARGQMRGSVYASIRSFPPGGVFDVSIPVENPDGDIAYLKAFTIAGLDNPVPISGALRFG